MSRGLASQKANRIENDIQSGHFDESLKSYKPQRAKQYRYTAQGLLDAFWNDKGKRLKPPSLENYRADVLKLQAWSGSDPKIQSINKGESENFCGWLSRQGLAQTTEKTYVTLLSALWDWAVDSQWVKLNPWKSFTNYFKAQGRHKPKPFNQEEIGAILECFRLEVPHYYPPVAFLFGTGCRIGEMVALGWGSLSPDCSKVIICESVNRGVRSGTKTKRDRTIQLTENLQRLLVSIRPENPSSESAVFKSPEGCLIHRHNFRNRVWRPVLNRLEIDYRKLYTTRSSLISYALEVGLTPLSVAELVGNSPRVIYQNYAGSVGTGKLPEVIK